MCLLRTYDYEWAKTSLTERTPLPMQSLSSVGVETKMVIIIVIATTIAHQ